MPANLLTPRPVEKRDYLAFLGRISPEKGADRAIRIAARAGMKIKIAAKVDNADKAYFDREIAPLLGQGHVEFIGEIDDSQKPDFLSGARALLSCAPHDLAVIVFAPASALTQTPGPNAGQALMVQP